MAVVIPIVNMKGGVGKTTLTVALAECLAVMAKKRVLVIDLDAQASCTFALLGRQKMNDVVWREQRNVKQLYLNLITELLDRHEVSDDPEPTPTAWNSKTSRRDSAGNVRELVIKHATSLIADPLPSLSLLASDPELRDLEHRIMFEIGRQHRLSENPEREIHEFTEGFLRKLKHDYHYIIVDCPPGISTFTGAILRSADHVLCPVMPDYLSEMGLRVFVRLVLRRLKQSRRLKGKASIVLNRLTGAGDTTAYIDKFVSLAAENDDVLTLFPHSFPQSPNLTQISSAGDEAKTLRDKYGDIIPILEDSIRELLRIGEHR